MIGPGYKNVDLGVAKKFRISESVSFSLLGNFFDLFNHTNFENPDGNLADSAFGRSRAAFANRVTQLALRFDF